MFRVPEGWFGQPVQALLEVRFRRSLPTRLSGKLRPAVEEGISTAVMDNSQNCRNSTQVNPNEGNLASSNKSMFEGGDDGQEQVARLNKSVVQGGGEVGQDAELRSCTRIKSVEGKAESGKPKSTVEEGISTVEADNSQKCRSCTQVESADAKRCAIARRAVSRNIGANTRYSVMR